MGAPQGNEQVQTLAPGFCWVLRQALPEAFVARKEAATKILDSVSGLSPPPPKQGACRCIVPMSCK